MATNPSAWYIKAAARGKMYGYRSGLEKKINDFLESVGIEPKYESIKIPYRVEKDCKYTPDFPVSPHIYIETKGRFMAEDRVKHLLLKEQYPEYDFRFVFTNSKAKLYKGSKTSYADWCEKHGFKYADKVIPQEWIEDIRKDLGEL